MAKRTTALLIQPQTIRESEFIQGLLERLGVSSRPISEDDLLDLGLSQMMRKVDRRKRVDPKAAMKVLAR